MKDKSEFLHSPAERVGAGSAEVWQVDRVKGLRAQASAPVRLDASA